MKTIALIHRVIPFLITGSLCLAGDLTGKVKLVGGETADVELTTDLLPETGDKAEFFFKVPGKEELVAIGSGSVSWVGPDTVKIKIEETLGTVTRNQLVTIHSANPKKRKAGVPANAPKESLVKATPGTSRVAESVTRGVSPSTETSVAVEKTKASAAKSGEEGTVDPRVASTEPENSKPKAEGAEGTVPPRTEPTGSDGKTAKDHYTEGLARHKAGDRDAAASAYSRAIEVDPYYAPAYYNRACVHLVKRDYDALITDTTKALELGHTARANLFCMRGTGWAGKSNFDKALADHTAAIEIDPKYALAYNNRGNDYYRKRDMTRAMKDCDKSIELDPASPLPWYNRGYIHYSLRKYSSAVEDWQKALELKPDYAPELEPLITKLAKK